VNEDHCVSNNTIFIIANPTTFSRKSERTIPLVYHEWLKKMPYKETT